jgi:hypothetical protein
MDEYRVDAVLTSTLSSQSFIAAMKPSQIAFDPGDLRRISRREWASLSCIERNVVGNELLALPLRFRYHSAGEPTGPFLFGFDAGRGDLRRRDRR